MDGHLAAESPGKLALLSVTLIAVARTTHGGFRRGNQQVKNADGGRSDGYGGSTHSDRSRAEPVGRRPGGGTGRRPRRGRRRAAAQRAATTAGHLAVPRSRREADGREGPGDRAAGEARRLPLQPARGHLER